MEIKLCCYFVSSSDDEALNYSILVAVSRRGRLLLYCLVANICKLDQERANRQKSQARWHVYNKHSITQSKDNQLRTTAGSLVSS